MSFRSKINRLIGLFEIEKYFVNGIDSTFIVKNQDYVLYISSVNSKGEGEGTKYLDILAKSFNNEKTLDYGGEWRFDNNKKQLIWGYNVYYDSIGFYLLSSEKEIEFTLKKITWDIKKLTENELIIETETNGNYYRMEFVKKEQYKDINNRN